MKLTEYERDRIYDTYLDIMKATRILHDVDHNFHMILSMNLASSVIRNVESIFNTLSEELYQMVVEYDKENKPK